MPAGDLLAADGQAELQGYLFGTGCPVRFGPLGIQGLRSVAVVGTEQQRTLSAGAAAGFDPQGPRVVTFDLMIRGYSTVDVEDHIEDLMAAFSPSGRTDVELHLQRSGARHRYLVGRPRGLTEAPTGAENVGLFRGQGLFLATDPTIYEVP